MIEIEAKGDTVQSIKTVLLVMMLLSSVSALGGEASVREDVVELLGPYHVSSAQAQKSTVHFYLPEDSVGVVGVSGADIIADASDHSADIHLDIASTDKTLFIKNDLKPGQSSAVGVSTGCGLSLSVVIHSLEKASDSQKIKSKVSVAGPDQCPDQKE